MLKDPNTRHLFLKSLIKKGGLLIALIAIIFGLISFLFISQKLPSVEQIKNRKISQSTKIYDRTGDTLLYDINAGQKRTIVPLEEVPQFLKDATISVEDEKFYEEAAFDWLAIIRALLVNLIHGKIMQGGSTITQQLAKKAFLTDERTVSRKVKEFFLAIQINRHYSKDEILELYLNEIPYGPMIYGVESAAQAYFNKPAKNLDLAESAVIAAIPKAPTYYSPWGTHIKELMNRQKSILKKMNNLEKISKEQLDAALKEKISFSSKESQSLKAPHFTLLVQDYLIQKYGESLVRNGGLKVITTLDWNLQQAAEKSVEEGVEKNTELYKGYNAALIAQDAKTGQVLALVGSKDYFASSSLPQNCTTGLDCKFEPNFNVVFQGLRQPGSALKPFVYLTAFQKGYRPETVLFDVPTEFAANNPNCPLVIDFNKINNQENEISINTTTTQCFHPEDFDGVYRGPVSLRQALAQSINIPAVKTLYLAGLPDVVKNANRFGLETLTDPNIYGLSLTLGGGAIKLSDLVEAYYVLAQEGEKHQQTLILQITDANGNVLESYDDQVEEIVNPQYPRMIDDILSDTEARSGLFKNSLYLTVFPEYEVALKTGTSNDYRDAWAIGYTPSLVVGIWAGNNDNSPMQKRGSSILAAVPIWHDFMVEALKSQPKEAFTQPDQIPTAKPILVGEYAVNNEIHTILKYVNRQNPEGAEPVDPTTDSQFNNWETGIQEWLKTNVPSLPLPSQSSTTQPFPSPQAESTPAPASMEITITSPLPNTAAKNPLYLRAQIISGEKNISQIKIYLNSKIIDELNGNLGKNFSLNRILHNLNFQPQNILEIEARNESGNTEKATIGVYKP